jgi:hypothetical protein
MVYVSQTNEIPFYLKHEFIHRYTPSRLSKLAESLSAAFEESDTTARYTVANR